MLKMINELRVVFAKGAPGRSARIIGAKKSLPYTVLMFLLLMLLALLGFVLIISLFKQVSVSQRLQVLILITFLVGFIVLAVNFLERRSDEVSDSWLKGARGEWRVGVAITPITHDENFRVLNDLNIGHGNIDHVIVGRTGVLLSKQKLGPVKLIISMANCVKMPALFHAIP